LSFPETIANLVLDELKIVTPEDLQMLDKIAWARRAQVVYEPLEGSEARLLAVPGLRSIITVSSTDPYHQRQRFSIAHELGHLEMHRRKLNSISCTTQSISPFSGTQPDIELQANNFASCFLLPERFVRSRFEIHPPSFDAITDTANQLNVSLTAAGSRYMQFVDEPMAFVVSQSGRITRFVPSQTFVEADLFVNVNEGVERNTAADRLARGQAIREGWHFTPTNAWLRDDGFMRGARIKEWSFFSQRFELTLSLIWADEDLYDEW
jgi:hypothetical protein